MTVNHTIVEAGEGWTTVAKRLAPAGSTAQQNATFAYAIAVANGATVASALYPGRVLHYDTASVPVVTPPPVVEPPPVVIPPIVVPPTTGPGGDASKRTATSITRTSLVPGTTVTRPEGTFKEIRNLAFKFPNGEFLNVDESNVAFVNCSFFTDKLVSNTSASVQGHSTGTIIVEDCAFDGGPFHNRGVQSDSTHLKVRRCTFYRNGNAAVEMNNRNASTDLVVDDCTVTEIKGWPKADHADGLQFGGARSVVIRRNKIYLPMYGGTEGDQSYVSNSCVGGWAELGNVTGEILIEDNDFDGGGCNMYLEQKSPYKISGPVTVRRNIFRNNIWHYLAPNGLPAQLLWENNTKADGSALSLAQAKA